jgi:hypothetical protein
MIPERPSGAGKVAGLHGIAPAPEATLVCPTAPAQNTGLAAGIEPRSARTYSAIRAPRGRTVRRPGRGQNVAAGCRRRPGGQGQLVDPQQSDLLGRSTGAFSPRSGGWAVKGRRFSCICLVQRRRHLPDRDVDDGLDGPEGVATEGLQVDPRTQQPGR